MGDPSKHSRDKLTAVCGSGVKGALLFACSPVDLSELLKEGTKESHDRAENTQFVKDFLKGRIKKELFKVSVALLPISLMYPVTDADSKAEPHSPGGVMVVGRAEPLPLHAVPAWYRLSMLVLCRAWGFPLVYPNSMQE